MVRIHFECGPPFLRERVSRLLIVCPIEKRHDLTARAAIVGAEQTAADALGHAVGRRPGDCLGKVAVSRDVTELRLAGRIRVQRAGEERHRLRSCAGRVGREAALTGTGRDALAQRPANGFGIVHVLGNIRQIHGIVHHRRPRRAPEEGHDLGTGAGLVRCKEAVTNAVGDAVLDRPLDRLVAVSVDRHIGERADLDRLYKARLDLHAPCGHHEAVSAVAEVGERELVAAAVGDDEALQLEALVGRERDGHALAALGIARANGDLAVLRGRRADGIGRVAVVIARGGRA